ncbi:MAG TPA: glycosyltransferase [Patescibacteria group bacterium]|nr:glycosyltransferase [Patescibacteria group bacterium]
MDKVASDDSPDVQLARNVLALRCQTLEVVITRVLTLLLHDERFSGWTPKDKVERQHFSIEYMRFYKEAGFEPLLYSYHQEAESKQIYRLDQTGTVKIFPVKFRFPPFLRFGNDHNPEQIAREMLIDKPELVHFHNYYLFSFPYIAAFVKRRLGKPLVAQLHGYDNRSVRKWMYLPCLLALRNADRILYSYEPEREMLKKLGVAEKAVKLPVPGIDPEIFKPKRRKRRNRLLYVGRIPTPETAHGEKSPFLLIQILKKLLRLSNDFYLDIVGDGPGLARGRSLAKDLRIGDRVVFHGYVPHDQLPEYYRSSALTFSPIQVYDVDGWFDGAIQESLACGTPVAALKMSPKTPLQGTYGFLLSNNAEKAAADIHMLLRAPEDTEQIAVEGSRFVRENCSRSRVMSELDEMLESVMCN